MSEGRWDVYVRDMVDCCARIVDYSAGLDRAEVALGRVVIPIQLVSIFALGCLVAVTFGLLPFPLLLV